MDPGQRRLKTDSKLVCNNIFSSISHSQCTDPLHIVASSACRKSSLTETSSPFYVLTSPYRKDRITPIRISYYKLNSSLLPLQLDNLKTPKYQHGLLTAVAQSVWTSRQARLRICENGESITAALSIANQQLCGQSPANTPLYNPWQKVDQPTGDGM